MSVVTTYLIYQIDVAITNRVTAVTIVPSVMNAKFVPGLYQNNTSGLCILLVTRQYSFVSLNDLVMILGAAIMIMVLKHEKNYVLLAFNHG